LGSGVAISGDTVIVGARGDDDTGSVYVFEKPGAVWTDATEDAKLTASDAEGGDNFGVWVAISGDTVVVGANGDDDGGNFAGSAYVYFVLSGPVGGELFPIDSTALLLAGLQSSAIWMLPVLAGVAGSAFGILYIKSRRN